MSTDLEQRVAALEQKYDALERLLRQREPSQDAWRDVLGLLPDDAFTRSIHREGARIREEDRARTRGDSES